MPEYTADENFSVKFSGPALDSHEISAAALAQSLLALDHLAHRAAIAAYGREAEVSVKVKGSPRPGSFVVDLIVDHSTLLASGAAVVTIITGLIALAKWAFGRKVERLGENSEGKIRVKNEVGHITAINSTVVNLYGQARTMADLARLTQTLDREGVDSISIQGEDGQSEIITRSDRDYFRHDEGIVLSDSETTLELEITGARFNGSPYGWTFYEGEDGREFTARMEDEAFLEDTRNNRIILKSGTTILAVVRTVQKRLKRITIERSIIEVLEVHEPLD